MRFGILLLTVLVLLFPSLAQARWLEARSPGFIVYSDGGEDDLCRSVMLLVAYDRLLRQLTGTTAPPSPSPLTVYRVASTGKLQQIRKLVQKVRGFYTTRVGGTAAFEADLKRYMQGDIAYAVIARPPEPAMEISLRILPEAADDLLLPHAALMLGIPDPKDEITMLETVRRVAASYPDDPYAQRVLAHAEINSGDRTAGVAMIDRLLQQTPDDAELLYVRGVADFYTGRWDEARRAALFAAARPWFARAVAADPGYYTAHYRLAQCAPAEEAAAISDETLAHLLTAQAAGPVGRRHRHGCGHGAGGAPALRRGANGAAADRRQPAWRQCRSGPGIAGGHTASRRMIGPAEGEQRLRCCRFVRSTAGGTKGCLGSSWLRYGSDGWVWKVSCAG